MTKAQVSYLSITLFHEQQHFALYFTLTVNNNITNPLYYTIIYTYDMPVLKLVLANTTYRWYIFLSKCNLESMIFNISALQKETKINFERVSLIVFPQSQCFNFLRAFSIS